MYVYAFICSYVASIAAYPFLFLPFPVNIRYIPMELYATCKKEHECSSLNNPNLSSKKNTLKTTKSTELNLSQTTQNDN